MLQEAATGIFSTITLVLWLGWLGAGWLCFGIWLSAVGPNKRTGVAVAATGLLVCAVVLVLTTDVVGSPWIGLDNRRVVLDAMPYYVSFSLAAVCGWALWHIPAVTRRELAVALSAILAVAVIAIWRFSETGTIALSQRITTLAADPPAQPISHARFPGMVYVPSGPFIRGSLSPFQLQRPVGSEDGDEQPVRSIYLSGFFIDRTEVSNEQFAEFVEQTRHVTDAERSGGGLYFDRDAFHYDPRMTWRDPAGDGAGVGSLLDHPVVHVSWFDAKAYCEWRGLDLPTEAQWEKAARGVDGRIYPWGDEFDARFANYCDASCVAKDRSGATESDGFERTAPVDAFAAGASPYGALNMAGNVWEWVNDWYDPRYYGYAPAVDPRGPSQLQSFQAKKVVHGGSFVSEIAELRTASRSVDDPRKWRSFGVGFRCAVTATVDELERP